MIGGNLAFGIQWCHFTTSWDSNVDETSTMSFFTLFFFVYCFNLSKFILQLLTKDKDMRNLFLWSETPSYFYPLPVWFTSRQESDKGYVMNRVCLFTTQDPALVPMQDLGLLVQGLGHSFAPMSRTQALTLLNMFKLVQSGPHCTGTSGHVQAFSLCSTDCWKVGSWHSTEIPSCS